MKKQLSPRDAEILIVYQWASIEHVFPCLRLVSITLDTNPEIYFYVHGEPSWDDRESMNLVHTYFGVGLGSHIEQGSYDVFQIDAPAPIENFPGECVYARKEETPLISYKSKIHVDEPISKRSLIFLTMQRAMINNVFPELRSLQATWEEASVCVIVVVDKELSEKNKHSLECIRDDFIRLFPETTTCSLKIIQIDMPTRLTEDYGPLIYSRKDYLENDSTKPYDMYTQTTLKD